MSKYAAGPRLQIFLEKSGSEGRQELLLDSAVDPVLEWTYKHPESILEVRVLDQNGNVAQTFAKYSLSEYVTRSLTTEFQTKTGIQSERIHQALIEDETIQVTYVMRLGDEGRAEERRGIVLAYQALNGTDDNSVVQLFIAPGVPYQFNRKHVELGVSTRESSHEFMGPEAFGTEKTLGSDYSRRKVHNFRVGDLMDQAERLMGLPAANKPMRRNAVVVLPDSVYDAAAKRIGNVDKSVAINQEVFNTLRMGVRRPRVLGPSVNNNTLRDMRLSLSYDRLTSDQLSDLKQEFRGMPVEVLQTVQYLKDLTDRVGAVVKWRVLAITDPNWINILSNGQDGISMLYLFLDSVTAQEFSNGFKLTKATKSRNAIDMLDYLEAIDESEKQKWKGVTKDGLLRLINGNRIMVFRSGVKNSNVLNITELQRMGDQDIGILQGSIGLIKRAALANAPVYPGTEDLKTVTKEQWDATMKQFGSQLATRIRGYEEAQEYLISQGYTFTDDLDNKLEEQINKIVDSTLDSMMGYQKDPGALAAYLNFLMKRQEMGGDTISVKVPLQLGNVIDAAYRNLALLQYAKSPATDEQLVFDGQLLSGWYEVISTTHTVRAGDAYSVYEMVKRGPRLETVEVDAPIEGDDPEPDPVEEESVEETVPDKPEPRSLYERVLGAVFWGGFS